MYEAPLEVNSRKKKALLSLKNFEYIAVYLIHTLCSNVHIKRKKITMMRSLKNGDKSDVCLYNILCLLLKKNSNVADSIKEQ